MIKTENKTEAVASKGGVMGKMKIISKLCEEEDRDGLIKMLNATDLTKLTGKTIEEVADGFIDAHKKIIDRGHDPAYRKLNEIHNRYKKEARADLNKAKMEAAKGIKKDLELLIKDIKNDK